MNVPGYEGSVSYGVLAPAGVPPAIVDKLNTEIAKALQDPQVRQRIVQVGGEVSMLPPAQYAVQVRDETKKWRKLMNSLHLNKLQEAGNAAP
jgi:tripartite-type tricarboxylate transporter receptor subunit TctC